MSFIYIFRKGQNRTIEKPLEVVRTLGGSVGMFIKLSVGRRIFWTFAPNTCDAMRAVIWFVSFASFVFVSTAPFRTSASWPHLHGYAGLTCGIPIFLLLVSLTPHLFQAIVRSGLCGLCFLKRRILLRSFAPFFAFPLHNFQSGSSVL